MACSLVPASIATGRGSLLIPQSQAKPDARWASLTDLYREHGSLVFRFLRRRGVLERDLDDAVQEVFVVAWRKLHTLRPDASARGWLLSIAYRVGGHALRDRKKAIDNEGDPDPLPAPQASPEDATARAEAAAVVRDFVSGLEDSRRQVFLLSEVDGLTAPEIAQVTETNLNTVYTRIRAVRRLFDQHLARHHEGPP